MTEAERIKKFRKMAERYTARHTVSRQAALAELVAEGIYTADGVLTPEYGGPPRQRQEHGGDR